jgi:hypothetical protein
MKNQLKEARVEAVRTARMLFEESKWEMMVAQTREMAKGMAGF